MKTGDTIYCIKSYKDPYKEFLSDHTYKIIMVVPSYICVACHDYPIGYLQHFWFSIDDRKEFQKFNKYFITIKEQRKIKINKLNFI